jgi:hypothetical protein
VQHQTLIPTLPNIAQISKEKILRIEGQSPDFTVTTKKNTYKSKIIVGYWRSKYFSIDGLMSLSSIKKSLPEKQRINYTIPITKWLKASTWQELLRDGEASLLQRAVAPQ